MQDGKTENLIAKADTGKVQLCLVPRKIIYGIAWTRMFGNMKYGSPDNWKTVEPERYRNALFRHLLAYLDDPYGVDKDSELPHLCHLATNCAFLMELEWEEYKKHGYSEKDWTGRPSTQETAGVHGIEGDGAYKAYTVLYGADET